MKKIAGKIAIILILVILVNCFTSCRTDAILPGLLGLGIVCLVIYLYSLFPIFGYNSTDTGERMAISDQDEESAFMGVLCSLPESELFSLKEKIDSLPEAEITAQVHGFNSMPEKEIISSIKKINSIPEKQLVSLVNVLQHVEAGYTLDNKTYLGLRFQF